MFSRNNSEKLITEARDFFTKYDDSEMELPMAFKELPISKSTLTSISKGGFHKLTPVQRKSLSPILIGRDTLVEAPTGSGKTLGYLIPLYEKCMYEKIDQYSIGTVGLILVPTREIAVQVFNVIKKCSFGTLTRFSRISVGVCIGGVDYAAESAQLAESKPNIIIATPGRLNAHLDQSFNFSLDDVFFLALDEADRMVDMGFETQVNQIFSVLPKSCQRTCWSATLKPLDLLKKFNLLSIRSDCAIITIRAEGQNAESSKSISCIKEIIPPGLSHFFVNSNQSSKINVLIHFLLESEARKANRIIIFTSTCKTSRFLFEVLNRLKSSIKIPSKIFCLFGKQNLSKRLSTTEYFASPKHLNPGVIICTDVMSRGIDLPKIDWVINFDIAENQDAFVHRIGRCARNGEKGSAFTLCSSDIEVNILKEQLTMDNKSLDKQLLQQIKLNRKIIDFSGKISNICAGRPDIKHLAEKSIFNYCRFFHLNFKIPRRFPDFEDFEKFVKNLSNSHGVNPSIFWEKFSSDISKLWTENKFKSQNEEKNVNRQQSKQLMKLKEKIKAKKEAKKKEKKEINREQEIIDNEEIIDKKTEMNDNNKPEINEDLFESEEPLEMTNNSIPHEKTSAEIRAEANLKKQKIRIRKDGVAIVKGAGGINQKKTHLTFNDSDDEDEKEEVDNSSFINDMNKVLNENMEMDKSQEKERIRLKRLKRKFGKIPEEQENTSVVLGDSGDEGDMSIEDMESALL